MTLTALAKQLNVSTMTIYRRCKAEGVNVKDYRDNAQGELTSEGVAVIASLFDATGNQQAQQTDATHVQRVVSNATQPAEIEAAVLRAKLDGMETTLEMLRAELDRQRTEAEGMRAERDRLLTLLEVEQRQRQQLLTDGRQRRGLFGWFKSRGSGGND